MNIKYNILPLFAAVSMLTACSDDDIDRVYTVGEADNAIVLKVGVSEGNGTQISTRGVDDNHGATDKTDGSNVYGGGHVPFTTTGTQLALRIDGMWKTNKVSQSTLVTLGTPTTETTNKHNPIASMAPTLFWDDYGTADPDNMKEDVGKNGRKIGLTIYGMGVDGYATSYTSAETISTGDWTNLSWNVGTPSSGTPATIDQNTSNYWKEKDLLTSNNIRSEADGTLKFDDWKNKTPGLSNILKFTHAMTKITVELTAGEGFLGYSETSKDAGKFEAGNTYGEPTVTLEGFNYTGTVNVEAKTSTPTANTTANIKMHLQATAQNQHTATFDALVFPGNSFESATDILTLSADGNTYKVTATELNKAIQTAITNKATTKYPGNDNTLLQAWNYLLKIRVNKTDLEVTATILDWKTVEAAEEEPKINVTEVYGHEGTAFKHDFDFFRSTSKESGYSKDAYVAYSSGSYTFHDQLYWPNHQTHYFFRGVYPRIGTAAGAISESNVSTASSNASAILVSNKIYEQDTYPSDLAIGWPKKENDVDFDETCKVHTGEEGICATEGQIRMNFKYMMSQVEVELKTVDSPDAAKVNIGSKTIVELVNVYNNGAVKLSDGTVTGSGDKGDYPLDNVAGNGNELLRHSAIVPQTLTFTEAGASSNVRFKITVTNDDAVLYTDSDPEVIAGTKNEGDVKTPATTDIYYADINPILKDDKSGKVAPNGKWESGVHYKYVLTLSKTAINVTATLTDWETVTANDEIVWF